MQPYKQSISHDGYSQINRRSDLTDAAMLTEELTKIYSTPTPKGGTGPKKLKVLVLIDAWMSITIVGVPYLYPKLDYESRSNKTSYDIWKRKQNILN